jgi:hypothetical protein
VSSSNTSIVEWDVALSFAGEQREYVEAVADRLRALGVRVFYDAYVQHDLWGKDLYTHLDQVYRIASHYCVLFISKDYAQKVWTNHERKSAQARAFVSQSEYILPARFDNTELPGVLPTTGYIDLSKTSPDELAILIARKLGLEVPLSEALSGVARPAGNEPKKIEFSKLVSPPVDEENRRELTKKVDVFLEVLASLPLDSPRFYRLIEDMSTMGGRELQPIDRRTTLRAWEVVDKSVDTVAKAKEYLSGPIFGAKDSWLTTLASHGHAIRNLANQLEKLNVTLGLDIDDLWTRLGRLHSYLFMTDELWRLTSPAEGLQEERDLGHRTYTEVLLPHILERRRDFTSAMDAFSKEYLTLVATKDALTKSASRLDYTSVVLTRVRENQPAAEPAQALVEDLRLLLNQDQTVLYGLQSLVQEVIARGR